MQTVAHNKIDLFWASSPAPFVTLKEHKLLARQWLEIFDIPDRLGSYPLHDPEGYYFGFAGSGFGMMWNTRYPKAKQLPVPDSWQALAAPVYAGHVGMSAPSHSGTTHVVVETMLQEHGWEQGWQTVLGIARNLHHVADSSFAVSVGVRDGEFGVGLVIDYYGLSAKAKYYPVQFSYPELATLLPASITVLDNAPNAPAALAFIRFLLMPEGQVMLLDKNVRRLPVRPEAYRAAPADYPNPQRDQWLSSTLAFDVALSWQRYDLVNALFDVMVTDSFAELVAARESIERLRAAQLSSPDPQVAEAIRQAQALLGKLSVDAVLAADESFVGSFGEAARREELVAQWAVQVETRYQRARELADDACERLDK
jgi:phosphoglycerate transport regulatory protein PgtC